MDNTRIVPSLHRVDIGGTTILNCTSYGHTMWFHITPDSVIGSSKDTYTINSANWTSSGYYFCYGSYGRHTFSKKSKHFLAKTEVRVYGEIGLF